LLKYLVIYSVELELKSFSKVYQNLTDSVKKRIKLIYSELENDEISDIELELENKEVNKIYESMFPCKVHSINLCFIYNVYLIMINN
jgi:hypothetical protein